MQKTARNQGTLFNQEVLNISWVNHLCAHPTSYSDPGLHLQGLQFHHQSVTKRPIQRYTLPEEHTDVFLDAMDSSLHRTTGIER